MKNQDGRWVYCSCRWVERTVYCENNCKRKTNQLSFLFLPFDSVLASTHFRPLHPWDSRALRVIKSLQLPFPLGLVNTQPFQLVPLGLAMTQSFQLKTREDSVISAHRTLWAGDDSVSHFSSSYSWDRVLQNDWHSRVHGMMSPDDGYWYTDDLCLLGISHHVLLVQHTAVRNTKQYYSDASNWW